MAGTFPVARVLNRASTKLYDETRVVWDEAELLADYNALKNTIVALKPDTGAMMLVLDLEPGSLQHCPAVVVQFRRAVRNMGSDGATPGNVITRCDRSDLDHSRPDWHTATGEYVKHWIADDESPLDFYIYPSAAGSGQWAIEAEVCATFDDALYPDDDLFCFPDAYEDCVFYGLLALAYCKDRKTQDVAKVGYYGNKVNEFLGIRGQAMQKFQPLTARQEQATEA